MYKFESRPINVSENNGSMIILCEDGSIFRWLLTSVNPRQIASYEKPVKVKAKVKSLVGYTEEFEYMWTLWTDNIKNSSNKKNSFDAFNKLTKLEQTALCYSIQPYSKTELPDKHKFLKRAESYINQRHWEAVASEAPKPIKEEVINRNVNLKGDF